MTRQGYTALTMNDDTAKQLDEIAKKENCRTTYGPICATFVHKRPKMA